MQKFIQGKCRTPELAPRSSTGLLLSQEPLSEDMGKNPSSSKLNSLPLLSLLLLMMAVMRAGPKAFKNGLNTAKLTRLTTEKIQHHKDKQPSSIYTHVYELKQPKNGTHKKYKPQKNTVNIDVAGASQAQNYGIYEGIYKVFFPW